MSIFGNAVDTSTVAKEKDFSKRTVDTGAYGGTIDIAFAGQSKGGARSVTINLSLDGGKKVSDTVYITNKAGDVTFEDKEGNKQFLPGYALINNLCIMATGKGLQDLAETVETKTVKLFDFDAKKEVPTDVQAITKLTGCRVLVSILEEEYEKKKQDAASGEYLGTGEFAVKNVILKVFHPDTRQTPVEIRDEAEATYLDKWLETNKGKMKVAPRSAAPVNQNSAPTASGLF